jgi:hypothetical protein
VRLGRLTGLYPSGATIRPQATLTYNACERDRSVIRRAKAEIGGNVAGLELLPEHRRHPVLGWMALKTVPFQARAQTGCSCPYLHGCPWACHPAKVPSCSHTHDCDRARVSDRDSGDGTGASDTRWTATIAAAPVCLDRADSANGTTTSRSPGADWDNGSSAPERGSRSVY